MGELDKRGKEREAKTVQLLKYVEISIYVEKKGKLKLLVYFILFFKNEVYILSLF